MAHPCFHRRRRDEVHRVSGQDQVVGVEGGFDGRPIQQARIDQYAIAQIGAEVLRARRDVPGVPR